MGPIGDSAVQSIGPVKKVMVYTKETFALIKQSIVKIVSSTKNIFSPTGNLISFIILIHLIYLCYAKGRDCIRISLFND